MTKNSIGVRLVNLFTELRAFSGRQEKLAIFSDFVADNTTNETEAKLLLTFLNFIYSGKITFGLRAVPSTPTGPTIVSEDKLVDALSRMASRNLSGSAAALELQTLLRDGLAEYHELVAIILQKDPKCGFGLSSVNSVLPKHLNIAFFGQHKAEGIMSDQEDGLSTIDLSLLPELPEYQVEIKYDGNRSYLVCPSDNTKDPFFLSANGFEFPAMASVAKTIRDIGGLAGYVLDGELVFDSLEKTRSIVSKGEDQGTETGIIFYTMGMLTAEQWLRSFSEPSGVTTGEMRKALGSIRWTPEIRKHLAPTQCKMVSGDQKDAAITALMKSAVASGFEGLVIKDPNQIYTRHKEVVRDGWWKGKFVDLYDAKIVDVVEGKGKLKGCLGAFVVEYRGVRGNVGGGVKRKSTGSSLSDAVRLDLWLRRGDLTDRVIRVQSYGLTKDGSFRHAAFVDFHDQK